MRLRAPFTKSTSFLLTCRTSTLEDAIFHRMNWCKFLWGNPCRTIETFYHWVSCLWDFRFSTHFSSLCRMEELEEGFGCVVFARSLVSWRNCIVSFRTLAVGFPLPTFSQTSLYTLFCPLDSWPRRFFHNFRFWPQNSYFVSLARYFFLPPSSVSESLAPVTRKYS